MGRDRRGYDELERREGPWDRLRGGVRRMFAPGATILDWSVPLYTLWGIRVKLQLIFILMIVGELVWSTSQSAGSMGLAYMAIGMASLFVLVLLHEYGHCFACRWVGGSADQIVMWPLGGLASCRPPHEWRADLITTLGGPAVNVALLPFFGLNLLLIGQGWGAVLFNPFDPGAIVTGLQLADGSQPTWLIALWWLHYTNLLILAFNMLVPMYPMDAGRTLHGILWSRLGHEPALKIALNVGLATAVVLFVLGITGNQSRLVAIALFGGITCWFEKKRLEMGAPGELAGAPSFEAELERRAREREKAERRREAERAARERDQAELDRLLAKIADQGMGSLTAREKKWLQQESERRRQG